MGLKRVPTSCAKIISVGLLVAACGAVEEQPASDTMTPANPVTGQGDSPASAPAPAAGSATDSTLVACAFPQNPPAPNATQAEFDAFSWRMFTAVNRPFNNVWRGQPDCTSGFSNSVVTVWQSYKFLNEIFLPGAQNPGMWQVPYVATVMKADSKLIDGQTDIGVLQPVGGWLIDQAANPTFYEVSINETSFNYIVNNDLYNLTTLESFAQVDFPDYSTEIKASWRVMTSKDDQSQFLIKNATIATFNSDGVQNGTTQATLGLVGLHVITKPTDYPQWIWSTFEQDNNITPNAAGFASYFNASAPANTVNQSPCLNMATPCRPKPGETFQMPNPLTRVTAITADTANVNAQAKQALAGTFLANYHLITTQRPRYPTNPSNPLGTPTPNIAANTTMESYIQPTSSCMACHQIASISPGKKLDFSFVLTHAKAPTTTSGLLPDFTDAEGDE